MKQHILNITDLAFSLKLIRTGKDRFIVEYGQQTTQYFNRSDAAKALGHCIMHALECDGKLD